MPRFVEPRTELGRVLRELRRERGLTARDLAERTGLSMSFMSYIETGYPGRASRPIVPSYDNLRRLGEVLGEGAFERLDSAARELRLPRVYRWGDTEAVGSIEREIRECLARMSPAHREMMRKMAQALADQDAEADADQA